MSANKKKKNLNKMEVEQDEDVSSSSDEDDEAHPDAYQGNEQVDIDFEGRAPVDPDAQGISQLLQRLFLRAPINCNQMADLLIAQNFVGSVICQCDDDDAADESEEDDNMVEDGTIFGITSVLNLSAKKAEPSIKQLRTYLLERAEKHATEQVKQKLQELLEKDQPHVGFLINERFINIPAQISVPLLQNLQQEIDDAKAKKMKFDFGTLLLLVKFYRKEKTKKGKPAEDQYTNAEEELLCERAKFSFEYSVSSECDSGMAGDWLEGDSILTPYRKLVALEASKLPQLIKDVQGYINGE